LDAALQVASRLTSARLRKPCFETSPAAASHLHTHPLSPLHTSCRVSRAEAVAARLSPAAQTEAAGSPATTTSQCQVKSFAEIMAEKRARQAAEAEGGGGGGETPTTPAAGSGSATPISEANKARLEQRRRNMEQAKAAAAEAKASPPTQGDAAAAPLGGVKGEPHAEAARANPAKLARVEVEGKEEGKEAAPAPVVKEVSASVKAVSACSPHRTAMKKLRIVTVGISGGRSLTRPFRDARRFHSTRL
jgi:hypothetical protein